MKQELDNLVAELCAFDTELAKDPALVGRLVEELTRSKPAVVVGDAFRMKLRAALLEVRVVPASRQVIPWWLLYTAPLGVVALVLMLVRPAMAPTSYLSPQELAPAPADAVMKMSPTMSSDAAGAVNPERMSQTTAAPAPTDYFAATLTTRAVTVSYLTLSKPGYLVVTDTTGVVVAVSDLYGPGEHLDTTFTTRRSLLPAVIYTATLYYDTGDGVFAKESDEVATDSTGAAVSLPLTLP